ncbi:unnamed protein product [Larinioides sclopetarius]|uniref:Uncharacterized protein n=1 Tax=Larinioides sclopetarius TaxID=280406 RepID=A0AAV2BI07_9ARAC
MLLKLHPVFFLFPSILVYFRRRIMLHAFFLNRVFFQR